jgi:hypothetical protein
VKDSGIVGILPNIFPYLPHTHGILFEQQVSCVRLRRTKEFLFATSYPIPGKFIGGAVAVS